MADLAIKQAYVREMVRRKGLKLARNCDLVDCMWVNRSKVQQVSEVGSWTAEDSGSKVNSRLTRCAHDLAQHRTEPESAADLWRTRPTAPNRNMRYRGHFATMVCGTGSVFPIPQSLIQGTH